MILTAIATLVLSQAQPVLTLQQAFQEAEESNLDLQAARARLIQADEISAKVWAGYLPQVSVSGNYTYNSSEAVIALPTGYYIRDVGTTEGQPPAGGDVPGAPTSLIQVPAQFIETEIQKRHMLNGTAQLTQGLIIPQLWPAFRNANLAERAAELSVENARREILFATAQLYYAAEGLREAVGVQERLLEVNRQHEADAETRFKVGTVNKVALLRAQIERAKSEQDLLRTRNAYSAARLALATLLNRPADFEVTRPPEPASAGSPEELLDAAPKHRPDVLAAQTNLELAEGQRSAVFYKYAPSLTGIARVNASNAAGFTGEYVTWTLGAALNWTIFDGGLRESELRENAARVVESRASAQLSELRARQEVQTAWLELQSAEANSIKAKEQLRLAKENADLVRVSFEAGAASYLDVVDANAALTGAELGAISEELSAQLATLRLAKAAGLFDPTKAAR